MTYLISIVWSHICHSNNNSQVFPRFNSCRFQHEWFVLEFGIGQSIAKRIHRITMVISVGEAIHVKLSYRWHLKQTHYICKIVMMLLYSIAMNNSVLQQIIRITVRKLDWKYDHFHLKKIISLHFMQGNPTFVKNWTLKNSHYQSITATPTGLSAYINLNTTYISI